VRHSFNITFISTKRTALTRNVVIVVVVAAAAAAAAAAAV